MLTSLLEARKSCPIGFGHHPLRPTGASYHLHGRDGLQRRVLRVVGEVAVPWERSDGFAEPSGRQDARQEENVPAAFLQRFYVQPFLVNGSQTPKHPLEVVPPREQVPGLVASSHCFYSHGSIRPSVAASSLSVLGVRLLRANVALFLLVTQQVGRNVVTVSAQFVRIGRQHEVPAQCVDITTLRFSIAKVANFETLQFVLCLQLLVQESTAREEG